MEQLLGELSSLCKKLEEAYAQHATEMCLLRDSAAAKKEHNVQSTSLSNAGRAKDQEDFDAKALNKLEAVPRSKIGTPQAWQEQDSTDVDLIKSQNFVAAEKEPYIQSKASFNSPTRADEQADIDGCSVNSLEEVILPGEVGVAKVWQLQDNGTCEDANAVQRMNLLGSDSDGGAFALRQCYIKDGSELARLNKAEKTAGSDRLTRVFTANSLRRSVMQKRSFEQATHNKLNRLVRDPISSLTKRNWDVLGCIFLIYDVFIIPLGAFDLPTNHAVLLFLEICSVVYWTSDIGMTMTTGYYANEDDEEPVMEIKAILRHYLFSKNFPFDLALVSIDWVILIITLAALEMDADNLSAVALARMVRVGRILRLLKLVRVSKITSFMENLRRWFHVGVDRTLLLMTIDLMKILCVAIVMFHYLVCAYFKLGQVKGSWISRGHIVKDEPFGMQYYITGELVSRRANTYTRNVEKDILTDTEKFFDLLVWCVSTGFITLLTSTVTSRMLEVAQRQRERNEKMHYIRNHYLKLHKIDPRLKLQLLKFMEKGYADYREAQQRQKNEADLLEALPIQLAKDFRQEAWSAVLIEHMFFKTFDKHEMEDICLSAVSEIFCRRREIVFKQSSICSHMLFIFAGQYTYVRNVVQQPSLGVMVCTATMTKKFGTKLEKGSWLSEPVLWTTSWQHRGNLLSTESGFFCSISPDALEIVLKSHEGALHDVVRYAVAFVEHLNMDAMAGPQALSDLSDGVMEKAFDSAKHYLYD